MASKDQSKAREDALRVAQWLREHRAEFEAGGIREDTLPATVGLSREALTAAVDNLENHEEVVRVPQALTPPPRIVLKPGRAFDDHL